MDKSNSIAMKKRNIIEALKTRLEKYSYSYISMQDVANEAGISKGGLRYYFPTKQSLFIGLLEDFFNGIEDNHLKMIDSQNTPGDKAVLSTLFNIERFVLDAKNIKIFLNLLLYGLEEPEMMKPISQFFRKHLEIYKMIIEKAKADLPKINKNEFDMAFHARITQIIFLSTGLMEAVDPTGMDPAKLARYVLSLFDE